ncbi:MAG: hypothetical protein ACREJ5_21405 [Geminicoccaceae bacterium]
MDKKPWKNIQPLQGPIEAKFLRSVYLGESLAPFRILEPVTGVIPWNEKAAQLLDSNGARARGFSRLAAWLDQAEALWREYGSKTVRFIDQLDYYGKLSAQFPIGSIRVVFAKAGSNPAAAVVRNSEGIVENALYWLATEQPQEALFLEAVLNSETARARAERYQAMGQWGARHFDKVMFNLPIPKFDPNVKLHRDLAVSAERAERVAAAVPLKEGEHFTRTRKRVRDALRADGVADEIDKLVERLLEARRQQIAA